MVPLVNNIRQFLSLGISEIENGADACKNSSDKYDIGIFFELAIYFKVLFSDVVRIIAGLVFSMQYKISEGWVLGHIGIDICYF